MRQVINYCFEIESDHFNGEASSVMKRAITSTAYHAGRHCEESELLDPVPECPLCGFAGERRAVLDIQRDPEITLLKCPACQGVSASRMPRPETLSAYYSSYRQDVGLKVTFFSPNQFASHIFALVGDRADRKVTRVLDFGGGDGSLSIAIADRILAGKQSSQQLSVHIDIIDYSQEPANSRHPSVHVRRLRSLSKVSESSYDLVIASSVMEHIPEPNSEFRALFGALRLGGCFYARTPYIVPVLQIFERFGRTFDFTYPAHVHDMGKEFWEKLVPRLLGENAPFQLCHSRPSPVETTFRQDPFRTTVAYVLKLPWRIAPNVYPFVGGWEVLFERTQ